MKKVDFVKNMFSHSLNSVTLFVTSRCNSKCKGCFYMNNLNEARDISVEEYEKMFKEFPELKAVLFSGGEPFLRNDLLDIIGMLVEVNKVQTIGIPTNGFLTDRIVSDVHKILEQYPWLSLGVYVSLDGLEETHDNIRGVKGSFSNAVKTIKELRKLGDFNLTVNTTIMKENYHELKDLFEFVKGLGVSNHTFDILRVVHNSMKVNLPSLEDLKEANKLRVEAKKHYANRKLSRIHSTLRESYLGALQLKIIDGSKWDFKCVAGENKPVIYANGDFALCELLPSLGNLKEKSFKELWRGGEAMRQREQIKCHACDCTHICYLSASLDRSFITNLKLPLK